MYHSYYHIPTLLYSVQEMGACIKSLFLLENMFELKCMTLKSLDNNRDYSNHTTLITDILYLMKYIFTPINPTS
jgi:hypothetical protein